MGDFFRKTGLNENNRDYLTGLYNRCGLQEIWNSLKPETKVHCIYIDVDNFKLANDIYGHYKGDELLVFISKLLRDTFTGQLVIRMGGDEFVVLCDGALTMSYIEDKMLILQRAFENGSFDVNVEKLLSFSIGISYGQQVSQGLNAILEQADQAMYHVKKRGKGSYIVYDEIRKQVEEKKAIKDHALIGLEQQEMRVLYRPIIYIQTSDIFAVEAVLEWKFPGKGVIPEETFLPIFRQYGIVLRTDEFVLEQACMQKRKWHGTEFEKLDFYIKLSGMYLMQRDCIDRISQCLEKYQIRPEELKICIEEQDFLKNEERMYSMVKELIANGYQIAINNFASASSLRVLQRFQPQILQFDSSLLPMSEEGGMEISILRNVISLGRDLHSGIVAKGIKNAKQIEMLANYGAQFGMGEFYGGSYDADTLYEKYRERNFFMRSRSPQVFSFDGNLADDEGKFQGEFCGEGLTYTTGVIEGQKAVRFPGGRVKENLLILPKNMMYSDSYSICFWINPEEELPWTSIFYIVYADGFMSLMPTSGHDDFFFRMKDDREANEWHDIMCRRAVVGQWSYICATYDVITGIAKLYFNGLLVGSRENMPNLKVVKQVMAGGDEYQKSYAGKLAGLEIYHYVLDAKEIEEKFTEYQKNASFLGTDGRK